MYHVSEKKMKELEAEIASRDIVKIEFNEMTFKEKVDHLWGYYKMHFLGTIAFLVLVISIGSAVYTNINTLTVLDISVFTLSYVDEGLNALQVVTQEHLFDPDETKNQEVVVEHFMLSEEVNPSTASAFHTKFFAKSVARSFDVMLMEPEFFENYIEMDIFGDFNALLDLDALGVPLEARYMVDGKVLAVDVSHIDWIKDISFSDATIYYAYHAGTQQPENIGKTLKMLWE